MKTFGILAIFLIADLIGESVVAQEQINGVNGWYIPQADGTLQWTLMGVVEGIVSTLVLTILTNPVEYYLYTKTNPTLGQQISANSESIAGSNFNPLNPTCFVVHGWNQSYTVPMNSMIRDAWFSQGDYNIIVVDWPRARDKDYISAALAVKGVGVQLATLIDYLVEYLDMSMDTLLLIGFSLGAHVVGFAGKNTKSQVKVIYGLDPAWPLFPYDEPEDRLNSTDAYYVETIQTNGGQLGQVQPVGKAAFYCDGGRHQSGCSPTDVLCSHKRAFAYYAECVQLDDFPTIECADYTDANENQCGTNNTIIRMCEPDNLDKADGVYYVPVHDVAPYGFGCAQENLGLASKEWPVDLAVEGKEDLLELLEKHRDFKYRVVDTNPVRYYLFTKRNPDEEQEITATTESISESNFNALNPTRFVIHGWTQSHKSPLNKEIRDAWLSLGDYNIISVDWARARFIDYISSAAAVPKVGSKLASMIDYLAKNHGMSMDTLQVIGHSMGAHVAGFAGKNIRPKIPIIVALDPARILFDYDEPNKRLNSNDALYVQSIITSGGRLGQLKPIGTSNFYCNGGVRQPGCSVDLGSVCSHLLAFTYYAEAVAKDNFPTMECATEKDAVSKACGDTYSGMRMGNMANEEMVEGIFYVPVHDEAPYGYGSEEKML